MAVDGALNSDAEATAAFEDWLDEGGMEDIIPGEVDQRTPSQTRKPQATEQEPSDDDDDAGPGDEADEGDELDDGEEAEELDAEDPLAAEADGEITTLELLAKDYEVEPAELLQNLEVEGVDGSNVPIGEALESWRESERTYELRVQELEDEFATTRQTYDETAQTSALRMNEVMKELVQTLQAEYSQDRLTSIRDTGDPDAYIAAANRAQHITNLLDRGLAAIDVESARQQSASTDDVEKTMGREHAKLMAKKPEWRNRETYLTAMQEGAEYLIKTIGFTPKQVSDIADHKMLLVVADAVNNRKKVKSKGSKRVEELKRRGLKKRSPGLRSQSRRDPENLENRARDTARARLRKTGDVRDAAALMVDHI